MRTWCGWGSAWRLLESGDVIIAGGDLGAGKTTLTHGIGRGLGSEGPIISPTFVLSRIHPSAIGRPTLMHVDAYRLSVRTSWMILIWTLLRGRCRHCCGVGTGDRRRSRRGSIGDRCVDISADVSAVDDSERLVTVPE